MCGARSWVQCKQQRCYRRCAISCWWRLPFSPGKTLAAMKKPPHKAVVWAWRVVGQVPHSVALGLTAGLSPLASQRARELRAVIGILPTQAAAEHVGAVNRSA